MSTLDLVPVILSRGSGTHLRPLSRGSYLRQLPALVTSCALTITSAGVRPASGTLVTNHRSPSVRYD